MKRKDNAISFNFALVLLLLFITASCQKQNQNPASMSKSSRILFLHHSTGKAVLRGNTSRIMFKLGSKGSVDKWINRYNRRNGTKYEFTSQVFPKASPYGWNNYPYDYYNIWVKNGGDQPFKEEPTLEMLTKDYDVIVFKHCYPGSDVEESKGEANVDSDKKTIENYKLQYDALKAKMRQFPKTKFILWTGAAQVKNNTNEADATRAKEFFEWVVKEWDEKGDNIFIWDFRSLETEGGLYFRDQYAATPEDSHPSAEFAGRVAKLFGQRVIDVIEDRGDAGNITGNNL
jgi:hypothetical protein